MTDTIEEIRARHEAGWGGKDVFALMAEMNDDRATLLRALDEAQARVKRLEADLQVIAFGWRYVAEPDNSFTKVDWTRDQLIEYARAALNQETGQ